MGGVFEMVLHSCSAALNEWNGDERMRRKKHEMSIESIFNI